MELNLEQARREGATALQLRVVELRNEGTSWRVIARTVGASVRSVREAWGTVNRRQRGGEQAPTPHRQREDATIGNEELLRGIPVSGYGGAVRGTRPGDRPRPEAPPPARREGVLVLDSFSVASFVRDVPKVARLTR
jgi:hypothetical protein